MLLDNVKFFVQTLLRSRPRGAGSTASGQPAATPLIQAQSKPAGGTSSGSGSDTYFLEVND
eukprot:6235287-Amphidinium_carterae.1